MIAQNNSCLPSYHDGEKHEQCPLHRRILSVHFEEPNTGVPVEALPRLSHTDTAASAKDLRYDFAIECPVEGDDRIVLLGKQGGLDTLESDVRRDDDEHTSENSSYKDDEGIEPDVETLGIAKLAEFADIHDVRLETECGEHLSQAEKDGLLCHCVQECRSSELAERGTGRYTLEGALVGRLADNDVCPCGVKATEDSANSDADDGTVSNSMRNESEEEGAHKVVYKVVGCQDVSAAKAGKETTMSSEVRDGAAELSRYRLRLDEEDLLFEQRPFLGLMSRRQRSVGLGGADDECRRARIFDHGESADKFCIGVADGHTDHEIEDRGESDKNEAPCWHFEGTERLLRILSMLLNGLQPSAYEMMHYACHDVLNDTDTVEYERTMEMKISGMRWRVTFDG